MIEAYLQQLRKYYKSYLKSVISGEPFTPFILRGGKSKPRTTVELHTLIAMFQQFEKKAPQKGWTISWEDWSSRILGKQIWASKIVVETEADYLFLLDKEQETAGFKQQLQSLVDWRPEIRGFLLDSPEKVWELKQVWPSIQKVVDYLLANDVSLHYLRSIPVPVHSKFMENHQSVILRILQVLAPERFTAASRSLGETLSVRRKPHIYPVRWLDATLALDLMHGMEVVGITDETMQHVDWNIQEVWLVENETNLYLIPPRKNALAIFSRGYATHRLGNIPFFSRGRLLYWGDLDEDGYEMLNAMREYYPHLQSVFMDENTLRLHVGELGKQNAVYKTSVLPWLTEKERAAYHILKFQNGRLEQERIRQDYIADELLKI
ncbi:DUF3322 and DUF2220 domain-containing protein [Niabella terrae]